MRHSLEGKTALVTGGSRGIGFGIARSFIDAGARVMLVARKADQLEDAAKELGAAAAWRVGHVGKAEDAASCVAACIQELGGLDILVNNAATNPYVGAVIDVDLPRWDKTFEVNLRGPLLWTQEAWRQSLRDHGGTVINISSVGGLTTSASLSVYNITKAALIHMTKQLASELAPKVRVNCIAPGLIRTDFARYLWDEGRGEQVARRYPLGRLGEPEDIGDAALFLAAGAGWMTGQTLVLDGGGLIRTEDAPHQ